MWELIKIWLRWLTRPPEQVCCQSNYLTEKFKSTFVHKVNINCRFLSKTLLLPQEEKVTNWISNEAENEVLEEDEEKREKESENTLITMEAQAVLDEITLENLMATLL